MNSIATCGAADVHIHSSWSDGAEGVRAILEHVARNTELDVISITDHDCIEGALQARRWAHAYPFEVIVGMEVSSLHGHILALFIEEPVPAGLHAAETVARIHAQGGIAIAAHPCERFSHGLLGLRGARLCAREFAGLRVDALEALNASLPSPFSSARAFALGRRLKLPTTGGSDSHHPATIGRAVTRFPGRTARDLRRGIECGRVHPEGARWGIRHYLEHFYHRRLRHNGALVWARTLVRSEPASP